MRYTPVMASSTLLLALAGMTALQRLVVPPTAKMTSSVQTMAHYEKAAECLEAGETEQALRALAPDPQEILLFRADLPELDIKTMERLPAGTFLFIGSMLSRNAKQAAERGSLELSQALLEACHELGQRLQRENSQETVAERSLRRSVADRLQGIATRTARELGQAA